MPPLAIIPRAEVQKEKSPRRKAGAFECVLPVAATAAVGEIGLGGGEAGDGHAVRGAGDVVEADLVAEGHRRRLAAMLAADAELDVRAHFLGFVKV